MKILNAQQIRAADAYTITHEPIASHDLMERAANIFVTHFLQKKWIEAGGNNTIHIFCGVGNNGGDGLCIARLLYHRGYQVAVYIVRFSQKSSPDFQLNEQRLKRLPFLPVYEIQTIQQFPQFRNNDCIIDALLGSGLNRPVKGFAAQVVAHINQTAHHCAVIAVDIPSGLYLDRQVEESASIVEADYTISFETPKLAFMFPQNFRYVGQWKTLPIGLSAHFMEKQAADYEYITPKMIRKHLRFRQKFDHKGTFGHVLVVGGSYGKIGASVLCTQAALKAGAGLATAYVPKCGYTILQTAFPEAMTQTDKQETYISHFPKNTSPYNAIAIGPGLGMEAATQSALFDFLKQTTQPLVLDADALNIIAKNNWLSYVPKNSILTPHPKEFVRLAGATANDYERLKCQRVLALKHHLYIVLKGAHTCIATPSGKCFFNSTGNPAMATAGSGDVLTGMIAGLLAQNYSPEASAILGVFLHGQAGDKAAKQHGPIRARQIITSFAI